MNDSGKPQDNSRGDDDLIHAAFEAIDFGIVIFDQDTRLVSSNEMFRKLLEFADLRVDDDLTRRDLYRALAASGTFGSSLVDDTVDAHMAAPIEHNTEELITSPEGQLLQIKWYPLADGRLCATLRDITTERETEEQLRQTSKLEAIGRLTGGVAHDFNNVLAVVYGNLELLKDMLQGAEHHEMIDYALTAAERGAKLTHRLLAFARRQPLSPEICRPDVLLRDLVPMIRSLLGEQIEVELVCDAGLWQIEVDTSQLETVIMNIAINARDAMPHAGKLTIEASNARVDDEYAQLADIERGQFVCITCSDNGVGMTRKIVEKAFDPFFTTKDVGAGTGLGLSMAHGFVKQSHGHIKIYSEPDVGTAVKIYLPRRDGEAITSAVVSGPVAAPHEGRTILVVEDDEQIRKTVERQLKAAGYKVLTAGMAAAALDILAEQAVDAVLTDVVLPGGMNGRTLAEEAKKTHPDLPIVYMSGYTENTIVHQGRLDKEVTLLQKPFRRVDLLRVIANLFDTDG